MARKTNKKKRRTLNISKISIFSWLKSKRKREQKEERDKERRRERERKKATRIAHSTQQHMLVFLSGQNSLINTDLTSRCSCTQIILDVVFHLEFVSLSFSRIISLLPISVVGFCVCSHHFFLAFRSQLKFTKTNFFSM